MREHSAVAPRTDTREKIGDDARRRRPRLSDEERARPRAAADDPR